MKSEGGGEGGEREGARGAERREEARAEAGEGRRGRGGGERGGRGRGGTWKKARIQLKSGTTPNEMSCQKGRGLTPLRLRRLPHYHYI